MLAEKGAELLLHGHDHCRSLVWLDGPRGQKIPAVGVPSASARAPHGGEDAAGYNLFRIDGEAAAWRCEMIARQRDADGSVREVERQTLSNEPARHEHGGGEQRRSRPSKKAEQERAERPPAPAAAFALGFAARHALMNSGSSSSARCRSTRRRAT